MKDRIEIFFYSISNISMQFNGNLHKFWCESMTVNLTVISVQITASQLNAEQMEISSGSVYASEQA